MPIAGLAELHANLRRLPGEIRAAAPAALEAAGGAIAADAAALAPRATGALAAAIDFEIDEADLAAIVGPAAAAAGRLDTAEGDWHLPAEYAERLEFGDETHDPQPYLRPGLDRFAGRAEAVIGDRIAAAIERGA